MKADSLPQGSDEASVPSAAPRLEARATDRSEVPVSLTDVALAAETYLITVDGMERVRHLEGETPGGLDDDQWETAERLLKDARATLEAQIFATRKAAR